MNKFGKWEYSDSLMISIPASLLPTSAWNWYRVFDRKEKTGIALVPLEDNARVIANAPEMYELIREMARPSGKNCMKLEHMARELLARIDGNEE